VRAKKYREHVDLILTGQSCTDQSQLSKGRANKTQNHKPNYRCCLRFTSNRQFYSYIFLLWTHGEDKLNDFITYLNNLHPSIKFTTSFSYNEIPFLDVEVMLLNGGLETDPTDNNQ